MKKKNVKFGLHISIAGGPELSVDRAKEKGCDCFQIFCRSPRSLKGISFTPESVSRFREKLSQEKIGPVIVHSSYPINLASPDPELYKKSFEGFKEEIITADAIGASFYVFHTGKHMGRGLSAGAKQVAYSMEKMYGELNPKVRICLENTAGEGTTIGGKWEEMAEVIGYIYPQYREEVGICFDTCHAFQAGYDIRDKKGIDDTLNQLESSLGSKRICVVHANDSKAEFGSHLDRHEHIGQGKIGEAGFKAFFSYELFRALPVILETPQDDEMDVANLATIRKLSSVSQGRLKNL